MDIFFGRVLGDLILFSNFIYINKVLMMFKILDDHYLLSLIPSQTQTKNFVITGSLTLIHSLIPFYVWVIYRR